MNSQGKTFKDSFGPLSAGNGQVRLTKEWKEYTIDLSQADLSSVIGGFCFSLNADENSGGCVFYLDDVVIVAEQIPTPLDNKAGITQSEGAIGAIHEAIMAAQKANVRESSGTDSYECFTGRDYSNFRSAKTADKIAAELLAQREIQAAILTLRKKSVAQREEIVKQWRCPLRKTWAQLGRISREGQTDAGQQAETDIANAVVDAILRCCD